MDLLHKPEIHITEFEKECSRLGIGLEDTNTQLRNGELRVWIKRHKDSYYVPSVLLSRLDLQTVYDHADRAPFSIVEGMVVPEQRPLVEQIPSEASAF